MRVPSYREKNNSKGETPQTLITEKHKTFVKQGEEWIKSDRHNACLCQHITTAVFQFHLLY